MGGCFMLPPFAHLVACCCMLLYVVACCCMLLRVVACCCVLLHVVACCCVLLRVVAYCCMLLHAVGCCCAKFETGQTFSTVQTGATLLANKSQRCWELLRPFARNLKQLEHTF